MQNMDMYKYVKSFKYHLKKSFNPLYNRLILTGRAFTCSGLITNVTRLAVVTGSFVMEVVHTFVILKEKNWIF